ncbi:hypothetical protein KIW84_064561 [Lathyrus oleraceus]|uniref:Uncharacterized protein n=1 Tax=Pisum sativum TaxID=3888 RepID=A0A9D4WEN8_PEA|nr:hypothetical protein KIW84_064561 [Pisum sativum]
MDPCRPEVPNSVGVPDLEIPVSSPVLARDPGQARSSDLHFETTGQREMLKIASENAESLSALSSSPKSPSSLLADHHIKAPAGGKAQTAGIAVRHVRRCHSGKYGRAKKVREYLGIELLPSPSSQGGKSLINSDGEAVSMLISHYYQQNVFCYHDASLIDLEA